MGWASEEWVGMGPKNGASLGELWKVLCRGGKVEISWAGNGSW